MPHLLAQSVHSARYRAVGVEGGVFEHSAVGKIVAVVLAAAHGNGVLLEYPQPGEGLSRVAYAGFGALNELDALVRRRGYARHMLEYVQRGAFALEKCAGVRGDTRYDVALLDLLAVADKHLKARSRVEKCEHTQGYLYAAEHALRLCNVLCGVCLVLVNEVVGSHVDVVYVFRKRVLYHVVDLKLHKSHGFCSLFLHILLYSSLLISSAVKLIFSSSSTVM